MRANNFMTFNCRRWHLIRNAAGHNQWQAAVDVRNIPADRVAIIICDMWDNHWSRGAVVREAAMIPRMNQLLDASRAKGVQIIHAPSETMAFYADHLARRRILALTPVAPPPDTPHEVPPLPVDASDHGSDTGETTTFKAWSRQHPAIVIDEERDLISDNGLEIYSLFQHQQIEQVLIMGVHTNMCVLNRSFAIKQMVRWGVEIALVRDMTDTMYIRLCHPMLAMTKALGLSLNTLKNFGVPRS